MPTTSRIKVLAEEARLFFHELHQRLLQKSRQERVSTVQSLDLERPASEARAISHEKNSYLRSRLRETPYWKRGHLLLGELSLQEDDVATAYACAKAVGILSAEGASSEADTLLGRCYLKRGAFVEATAFLEKGALARPNDSALQEDVAACYIGRGEFKKAAQILSVIPQQRLSVPGHAALLYSKKKSEPES
ncbi:MAG: hypothetical protein J0M12_10280 [Deltaproteobacteria bacterium]|nr:hypothetical protein [Deltaproteobacteria bacterium]